MIPKFPCLASANTPVPNMRRNKEEAHVGNCGNVMGISYFLIIIEKSTSDRNTGVYMNDIKLARVFPIIILIAYLAFICYFGFISKIAGRDQLHQNEYNLIPFYTIRSFLVIESISSLVSFVINIFGNLIVFMPVGGFTYYFMNKKAVYKGLAHVIIIGFIFSLLVELIQLSLSVGVFDIDDLILNTLGAIIGYGLYKILNVKFIQRHKTVK